MLVDILHFLKHGQDLAVSLLYYHEVGRKISLKLMTILGNINVRHKITASRLLLEYFFHLSYIFLGMFGDITRKILNLFTQFSYM